MAIAVTDPIDILLDADGDIVFEKGTFAFSSGVEGAAQSLRFGLQMIKGEWDLDLNEGMPWFENDSVPETDAIFGSKFNERKVRQSVRDVVDKNPLIRELLTLSLDYDAGSRRLSIAVEVNTIFGQPVTVEVAI